MSLVAEQIIKGLMHHGIRVAVNADSDLSLRGRTRGLTDEQRLDLRKHKPEVAHYLTVAPITPVAMYVAPDLEHWTTDEPHCWADKVTIRGRQFVRLTPAVIAWFRERIDKAEAACAAGKLGLDTFGAIIKAFCPVYEFALDAGLVQPPRALAHAMAGGQL